MYMILSVLHRNTLNAMQVTTGGSDLKAGLSRMIVIICMSLTQCITSLYLPSSMVEKWEFFFFFIH